MLNLTRQERQVVLFLVSVALLGAGIDFLLKKYSPTKSVAVFTQDLGKIDLNSAGKDLLMSVPGIGEKIAQRIIEYRKERAEFKEAAELMNIKGITKYRYEKMKDSFVVR